MDIPKDLASAINDGGPPIGSVVVTEHGLLQPVDPVSGSPARGTRVFLIRGDELVLPGDIQGDVALFLPGIAYQQQLRASAIADVAADDVALASALVANGAINNTLVNNFFTQMDPVVDLVRASGGDIGPTAAVVCCGTTPWAPLRLMAEGAQQVIANDVLDVQIPWSAADLAVVVDAIHRVAPSLAMNLWRAGIGCGQNDDWTGLVLKGSVPFEDSGITPESVDFLFSTSVLEHVMQPEAVYEAMAAAVRPGGLAFHSIDLRDHRDFSRPLDFLEVPEATYAPIGSENRLRAQDHVDLLTASGYRVRHLTAQVVVGAEDDVTSATSTEWVVGEMHVGDGLPRAVTERFDERFRSRDPRDLAILCLQVLAERVTAI